MKALENIRMKGNGTIGSGRMLRLGKRSIPIAPIVFALILIFQLGNGTIAG